MKVSVIVPVYNSEKYLARCLDSIICQTLKDIEIICINDGSKDNSLEILNKYAEKDARIKIINQENQGVSATRNAGVQASKGDFIGFVDSDDWIEEKFFENLYNAVIDNNCDMACCEMIRHNNGNYAPYMIIKGKAKVYSKTEDKYKACNIPRKCYLMNKIYNRQKVLETNYEFPVGRTFEDVIWLHVILDKLGSLVTVPKTYYYYECNPLSITETFNKTHQEDSHKSNEECMEYIRLKGLKVDYRKYEAQKRFRFEIFGLKLFDLKMWKYLTILYILGIPVCKCRFEENY